MAAPTTEHVRNVVLVGQDGAGKTSLAEAMLFVAGDTQRMGTTSDGKSYLDYDPEEIKRRFTINTSIAPVHYKDFKINVLDTSGHPDFMGEAISTMQAAEMALFVVDAVAGPQVMTTRLWKYAEDMRLSRGVFINHIDREHANFDTAMAQLQARFGKRLGAVTIPMGVDKDFKGVIDVIRMNAHYFKSDAEGEVVEDIPAEYAAQAENWREKLVELVVEADDELMMMFLEGEEITQEQLEGLLGKAITEGLFVPVFVGSTIIKQGIVGVMEDICSYFPSPTAHGRYELANGDTIRVDESKRPAAFVFKTLSDPFVGRLSFVKVIAGTLEPGMELVNSRTGKKERLGHIYVMLGKDTTDVKSAKAGDIIVVPKLSETRTGDTLSETGEISVAPAKLPTPMYPVAYEAAEKKDEDKLGTFLARMAENDPTIILARNEETHQATLTCMGDTQVEMLVNKCKEQANVTMKLVPLRVPYRETIRKTAMAQGRHKKQTGGSGQFGDCWLRLEPNPGMGYEFLDEIVGGKIPRQFIPAVDKGVQDAMAEGFLAGYPMEDIKCAVYDGSYHPVDSNEMAFKTAARIGFRACCEKANPILLEPMCNVDVTVPEDYAGAIMSDISTRRGRIIGTDAADPGFTTIKMRAPYAEMISYTKDLRSLTRGNGTYTLEIDGYEEAPADVKKKLVDEYQASKN